MEVDDRGEIKFALDICIERDKERGTLRISQEAYIDSLAKTFNLQNTGVRY